jgi:hypothetical protein
LGANLNEKKKETKEMREMKDCEGNEKVKM